MKCITTEKTTLLKRSIPPRLARMCAAFLFVLLIAGFPALTHGRGADESGRLPLTVYSIKGASGLGIIRLFDSPPEIPGFDVKVEALAQADLVAARFISGEAKIGILPPNVAAKIASSGRDIRALAVTGAGMISLLTSDPAVGSIGDLRGKTVDAAGQGASPEYVFRKILSFRGLDPDRDIELRFSLAYPEIAQSLIAGRIPTGLLPEPFASMALAGRPDLKLVGDIQEEWVRAGGAGNYPMTLLAADGAFVSANPGVITAILAAVEDSVVWVKAHPSEAGALAEKHGLGIGAAVAAAAIPKSSYVFIPAAEARPSLEALFKVFLENSPVSIGGVLPGDSFYHK